MNALARLPLRSVTLLYTLSLAALSLSMPGRAQDTIGSRLGRPIGPPAASGLDTELQGGAGGEERARDFRHALGPSFDHPADWRVVEAPQGIALQPADPARGPWGDAELYVVGMVGADPSVRTLDDQRAAGLVLQLVRTQLPFLQPHGTPRAVAGRRDLRQFTFRGQSPLNGQQIECRVHGLLSGGWFLAFTAVAEPAQLVRRQTAIDRIAARLQLAAPQIDAAPAGVGSPVGTWYSTARSSAGGIRDRINVASTTTMRVLPGGLLQSGTQSSVAGTGRLGDSVTGLTDEARAAGRWARVGNQLWVVWKSGGASRFTMHLQGQPGRRELLLTPPPGMGNKALWTEYRL